MTEFPSTGVTGKIKQLLQKIRDIGMPKKITVAWLKSIGFTSSNDPTLIPILKFIGLSDANGNPTDIWSQYRGNDYRAVLGSAIKKGYYELFSVYSDANAREQKDLYHFFSTKSQAGKQTIEITIRTFKALCDEADFSQDSAEAIVATFAPSPVASAPIRQNGGQIVSTPAYQSLGGGHRYILIFKFTFLPIRLANKSKRYLRVWRSTYTGAKRFNKWMSSASFPSRRRYKTKLTIKSVRRPRGYARQRNLLF